MLNLEVQCPELLHQLTGLEKDGSNTKLEDIYKETKLNQIALKEALGWSDDQVSQSINVDVDLDGTFPLSKKLMLALLPEESAKYVTDNPSSLWENRLESGMKISKAIARSVSNNEHIAKLFNCIVEEMKGDDEWMALRKELPKLPGIGPIGLMKDPMVFVQNFISEVSAAKTKQIGFTIDMFDFIRGCNSDMYTSCYTISRNFNSMAPISFAMSGKAAMIYNKNDQSILGRCWVIFSNTFDSFVIMKTYGFLSDESVHVVACNICAALNKDASWKRVNTAHRESLSVAITNSGLYGDPIEWGYSYKMKRNSLFIPIEIENITPRCMICGERVLHSRIICERCEKRFAHCKQCNTVILKPNATGILCNRCAKNTKTTVCPDCGRTVAAGAKCVCTQTRETCAFCESPSIISVNGVGLCAECAAIISNTNGTCEVCGCHGLMYPYKKSPLCQRCYVCVGATSSSYLRHYTDEQRRKAEEIRAR